MTVGVWPDFLAVGRNRRNSVILSAAKDLGEVGCGLDSSLRSG
jgi:hypothetical protein